jgi:L-ascorbate metabolism protein UlaG (beta-lactamase superfamily)
MIKSDTESTATDNLIIQPVNHASLVLRFGPLTIYSDPVGPAERYAELPRPDLILLTHEHDDHCDPANIDQLLWEDTRILGARVAIARLGEDAMKQSEVIAQGERVQAKGVTVEAIPAHNLSPDKLKFHPKGVGNGYILALGGKRIYISGDTEDTEDMLALEDIDVAFLPMNKFTMTGPQAASAARTFKPGIVYPFHYLHGEEHLAFAEAMRHSEGIEVRLRDWYAVP